MMENIVEMKEIKKSFSGVEVLHGVDFYLKKGEILGLVGENGAGKSTLMNILMGSKPKDSGQIIINGTLQKDYNVNIAFANGVTMIPQELALVPAITVGENILIAQRNVNKLRMVSWKELHKTAQFHIDDMGFDIDSHARLDRLPIAHRQLVAIIRAVSENKQVIIMDEPTSSLSRDEVTHLHEVIRKLKERGTTIIYISHLLDEIFEITDRITIMRDGNIIDTKVTKDTNEREVVSLMVGEKLHEVQDKLMHRFSEEIEGAERETVMSVQNMQRNKNSGIINFELKKGEILGITGLIGAGKTELIRNIFGLEKPLTGELVISGKKERINNPIAAIKRRLMLVPEDRKLQGLVLPGTVQENITLAYIYRRRIAKFGIRNLKKERVDSERYVRKLDVKIANFEQRVRNLSGGNQQKVVISKALITDPKILILDEPTRGIDVGAKALIYQLIRELRDEGMSILFVSSDINEVPLVCDRLLVMRNGVVVTELKAKEITPKNIINYVAGVDREEQEISENE